MALTHAGPLVLDISTTSEAESVPYALVIPAPGGLRALWQTRVGSQGQVFVADSSTGWQGAPIENSREHFLPGAGRCATVVGAYETHSTGVFRYKAWALNSNDSATPLFVSSVDLNKSDATTPSRYPNLPFIGDYTGTDCTAQAGWAAWTDIRNSRNEIWVAHFALDGR